MDECFGTETLVDLVEGRADAALRARIASHASRCDACRRLLSTLAQSTVPSIAPAEPVGAAPLQLGRYVIVRALGAGGMGIVYAAHDPELKRTVAVKLLRGTSDPRMQERLRREAQALAQLAHPNVVAVHDVGVHDGQIFIAMEHVAGQTLATWTTAARTPAEILDAYLAAGRGLVAAHAVGIVHRDFKPENVLVGSDGRVRVADFGLARTDGARLATGPGGHDVAELAATAPAGALTATGALAGTPYYMAPELYLGGDADARSDQFSFCVALFGALAGERPFAGESLDELRAEVIAGRIRTPRRRLPGRVAAALRRGLAVEPAARFPTLAELLAALAPRPRRWPWLAAPLAATALVTGAVVVTRTAAVPALCGGADAALRGVWDPDRKLALGAALLATHAPYADATRRETERLLDRYATDWQAMHTSACEATHVRKEQSAGTLDLRMTCLDDRRRSLDGVVRTLATADPAIAERAVSTVAALPALEPCADIAALRALVRPPNPAAAAHVAALRARLATVRAQRDAGSYASPLSAARTVLAEARRLGYRPLEAEAHALVALLERDTEDYAAARTSYEQAVLAAEAGRDDHATAAALIELVAVVGRGLAQVDEVPPLRARANAVLERLDHPPPLEAALLQTAGELALAQGQLADAARDVTAALALRERLHGRDDLRVVEPLRTLAKIELARERGAPARALLDRMLAIETRALGATHPEVGQTLSLQGGAAFSAGDLDGAIALYLRAQAILERAVGADSLAVANVLTNLATAYQTRGDGAPALAAHERAIRIADARLGAQHPVTLSYRSGYAIALADAGRRDEAIALLTSILATQRSALGVHQETAGTLEALAYIENQVRRHAAARDHAREARAMFERVLGDGYNPHVELAIIGEALYGLGDLAAACEALEHAKRVGAELDDPGAAAWLDAQLGRALVDSNRDVGRGRALVLAAYPRIAADARLTDQRTALVAWMKRRRIPVPAS